MFIRLCKFPRYPSRRNLSVTEGFRHNIEQSTRRNTELLGKVFDSHSPVLICPHLWLMLIVVHLAVHHSYMSSHFWTHSTTSQLFTGHYTVFLHLVPPLVHYEWLPVYFAWHVKNLQHFGSSNFRRFFRCLAIFITVKLQHVSLLNFNMRPTSHQKYDSPVSAVDQNYTLLVFLPSYLIYWTCLSLWPFFQDFSSTI